MREVREKNRRGNKIIINESYFRSIIIEVNLLVILLGIWKIDLEILRSILKEGKVSEKKIIGM